MTEKPSKSKNRKIWIAGMVIAIIAIGVGAVNQAEDVVPQQLLEPWQAIEQAPQEFEAPEEIKIAESRYEVGAPDRIGLLELFNQERAAHGLPPFTLNEQLNRSAQLKADDMLAHNYYAHISPVSGREGYEYITDVGITNHGGASEILTRKPNSQETLDSWKSSADHYGAIINPKYTEVGFGMADMQNGNYYVVGHLLAPR